MLTGRLPLLKRALKVCVATSALAVAVAGPTLANPAVGSGPSTLSPTSWQSPATTAEQQLADKYAPIIAVQRQTKPCGPGEPYLPTNALTVIDHPDVELLDDRNRVVKTAPTAQDLANAPDSWHIDFPGNALRPGCDFERWFRANGDAETTVYARVATDPDHPDQLALQYWFFWIYNDWNNLHEGDWEMVQIVFDAPTAQAALLADPVEMVVAQHEGAERGPWADVERRGSRPVVFPAGGSHATFFDQDYFLGKSASAGFGCDDTRGPSDELDPLVILLPEFIDPDDTTGEFAWVSWRGRWGEDRPFFNNGPEGPIAKTQWAQPITWMNDSARTSSLRMPTVAGDVTDLFCTATERASVVLLKLFNNPLVVTGLLMLSAGLLFWLCRRTVWGPPLLRPIAQRRQGGQILRSAWTLLRAEWRRFTAVAALVVIAGLVGTGIRALLVHVPALSNLQLLMEGDSFWGVLLSLFAGALVTIPVAIAAITLAVLKASSIDAETTIDPQSATVDATTVPQVPRSRRWITVAALITLETVLLGPLSFLIGVYLLARWAAAPALAARGYGFRKALRESARLSKGRRSKTAAVMLIAVTMSTLTGPLIGALILIATGSSFGLVNALAGFITAFLLPWLAIVLVMMHADLAASSGTNTATTHSDNTVQNLGD